MPMTAAEQYFIELLNRARLDPASEAARQGGGLNAGLPAGQYGPIGTAPLEVLAVQDNLDRAATAHSAWMASSGKFSHTGAYSSTWTDRAQSAGYQLDPAGWRVGENLSLLSNYGTGTEAVMNRHMENLWDSPIHRSNMMGGSDTVYGGTFKYREIGLSEVVNGGRDYLTMDLGYAASKIYVTGVVYQDRNGNAFYNIGEAKAGVQIKVGTASDHSESAGGYKVSIAPAGNTTVDIVGWGLDATVKLNTGQGSVKLDVVNGDRIHVAATTTLVDGISKAMLLGFANYGLAGSAAKDLLWGNKGHNAISGGNGGDMLAGNAGNDRLLGGGGADRLLGGTGKDVLNGGGGADLLKGQGGADKFVFAKGYGRDTVGDFSLRQGDKLQLDDALWTGRKTAAQVVSQFAEVVGTKVIFDFEGTNDLTLNNVSTLNGLAAAIEII